MSTVLENIAHTVRLLMVEAATAKSVPTPLVVVYPEVLGSGGTPVHMKITPGYPPLVSVSASWVLSLLETDTSELLVDGLRRAALASHQYATPNLNDLAPSEMEYVGKVRKFRKMQGEKYVLPERYYHEDVTLTLTCPLSGQSVTGTVPRKLEKELRARLTVELTQLVLQSEALEEQIDLIEAARSAPHCVPAAEVSLVVEPNGARQSLRYEP